MPFIASNGRNMPAPDFLAFAIRFLPPQADDKRKNILGIAIKVICGTRQVFGQVIQLLETLYPMGIVQSGQDLSIMQYCVLIKRLPGVSRASPFCELKKIALDTQSFLVRKEELNLSPF
jgi:hypothetical protein